MERRLAWCEQIASALEVAHSKGLVHRDVKPDNVLLSTDQHFARLCDFGLVYIGEGERVTMTEELVGSRFYIPPECEAGRASEVSASSDLYSLGKVLYYLASGGKIFPRERHRDDQYDLAKVLENPFLEHISRILDRFVRESPSRGEAKTFRMLTEQARRKVTQRLPCPGVFETYVCNFCGHGTYVVAATSGNDSHNEGYGTEGSIGSQYMVFLECNHCGNCQRFKIKYGGAQWFPQQHAANEK